MEEQLEQLKLNVEQAIAELNKNKSAILQLALNNAGPLALSNAEQKYDSLQNDLLNAKIEIVRFGLRKNNHLYEQLISSANLETERLTASVKQLNDISKIINSATVVINLVGQILKIPRV